MEGLGAPLDAPGTLLGWPQGALGGPGGPFLEDFLGLEGGSSENCDIDEIDIPYSTLAMFLMSQGSPKSTKTVPKGYIVIAKYLYGNRYVYRYAPAHPGAEGTGGFEA